MSRVVFVSYARSTWSCVQIISRYLSARTQLTQRQRRKLVEQWMDHGRVQNDHGDMECQPWFSSSVPRLDKDDRDPSQECHEPWNIAVACPFEHVEKRSEGRSTDGKSECPCLEEVADEQSRCGLVKPVSLLEHERLIYRHGYFWKSTCHKNSCTECERLCDLWMWQYRVDGPEV